MKIRKYLFYLPFLASIILNPLFLLPIYSKLIIAPTPSNMEFAINQSKSGLNVQSGNNFQGKIHLELFSTTYYQVERYPDLKELKLNGIVIVDERLELRAGKHLLSFSLITPEVEWPSKKVILSLTPNEQDKTIIVEPTIFPKYWDELTTILQTTGIVSIITSLTIFISAKRLNNNEKELMQIQELEKKNQSLQKHVTTSIRRINSLVSWIEDLLQDEPGLYEKALAYPPTLIEYDSTVTIEPIPLSELIDIEDIEIDKEQSEGISRILVKLGEPLSRLKPGGGE
jgi:hypothetical protein